MLVIVIFYTDTQGLLQIFATSTKTILLVQQGKYNGNMLMFAAHTKGNHNHVQ